MTLWVQLLLKTNGKDFAVNKSFLICEWCTNFKPVISLEAELYELLSIQFHFYANHHLKFIIFEELKISFNILLISLKASINNSEKIKHTNRCDAPLR